MAGATAAEQRDCGIFSRLMIIVFHLSGAAMSVIAKFSSTQIFSIWQTMYHPCGVRALSGRCLHIHW